VTELAVSSNSVAPGTLGFLVVAGMGLILFFLFRSMSKHLRKVTDQARREQEQALAASTAPIQETGTSPAWPGGPGEPRPQDDKSRP
jgi:hypothetical protein